MVGNRCSSPRREVRLIGIECCQRGKRLRRALVFCNDLTCSGNDSRFNCLVNLLVGRIGRQDASLLDELPGLDNCLETGATENDDEGVRAIASADKVGLGRTHGIAKDDLVERVLVGLRRPRGVDGVDEPFSVLLPGVIAEDVTRASGLNFDLGQSFALQPRVDLADRGVGRLDGLGRDLRNRAQLPA